MFHLIPPQEAVDEIHAASMRVTEAIAEVRTVMSEILDKRGFRDDQWQQAYDEGYITNSDLQELRVAKNKLERALEWFGEVAFSMYNGIV